MGACKGHVFRRMGSTHTRIYPNCTTCRTVEMAEFKDQVLEAVLGPKVWLGAPVSRDYSDKAFWDRLHRDKQLLSKLRREYLHATGASSSGLTHAERNDRLWAWLENQLTKAKATSLVSHDELHAWRRPVCSDCSYLVGGCKHPSAKVTDEAAPLRLKVAELEGRLALQKLRSHPRMGPAVGLCYTVALLTCTGVGALLGFLINLG